MQSLQIWSDRVYQTIKQKNKNSITVIIHFMQFWLYSLSKTLLIWVWSFAFSEYTYVCSDLYLLHQSFKRNIFIHSDLKMLTTFFQSLKSCDTSLMTVLICADVFKFLYTIMSLSIFCSNDSFILIWNTTAVINSFYITVLIQFCCIDC